MAMPMPIPGMDMPMPAMHAAFFWGHRVQVLFAGWPGADRAGVGMYLLCLLAVLALAALAEALSAASRGLSHRRRSSSSAAAELLVSGVHAAKMGLMYLVMLAVMSFNVGVFLAAVAGHAVGFLIARRGLLGRATRKEDVLSNGAIPPSEYQIPNLN